MSYKALKNIQNAIFKVLAHKYEWNDISLEEAAQAEKILKELVTRSVTCSKCGESVSIEALLNLLEIY